MYYDNNYCSNRKHLLVLILTTMCSSVIEASDLDYATERVELFLMSDELRVKERVFFYLLEWFVATESRQKVNTSSGAAQVSETSSSSVMPCQIFFRHHSF